MTIREALVHTTRALEAASIPDPSTDAALLLSHVAQLPPMALPLHGSQRLTSQQEQRIASLLLSRTSRRPLQYVLGEQCFYGLTFQTDERALIPRPETELLCELALSFLRGRQAPRVLDLCTGSGAIAVTLGRLHPSAQVTATDISPQALALAEENARRNHTSIRFLQGDLFAPVAAETFECILCNPPYIESRACLSLQPEVLFEPVLALDGGPDGLAFYRRLAAEVADHLVPGGFLALEIGAAQGRAVLALLQAAGNYQHITLHQDLQGADRMISAQAFPT